MSTDATQAHEPATTSGGETVLEVRDVKKHFPLTQGIVFQRTVGHVKAVDGVSFDLRKGETLGIVGESGCGKTTLGRLLMGLETATDGSIKLLGKEMVGLKPAELRRMRRDIQIVLQDPYSSLDPRMTVGDIVGEPFDIHPDALEGRFHPLVIEAVPMIRRPHADPDSAVGTGMEADAGAPGGKGTAAGESKSEPSVP